MQRPSKHRNLSDYIDLMPGITPVYFQNPLCQGIDVIAYKLKQGKLVLVLRNSLVPSHIEVELCLLLQIILNQPPR